MTDFTYYPNQISLIGDDNQILAEITFPDIDDMTVDINHTYVDPSLRGQGVAGQLMEAVVKKLQSENKSAVPTCSYAILWFRKHPQYSGLIQS